MATSAQPASIYKFIAILIPLALGAIAWFTYQSSAGGSTAATATPRAAATSQSLPRFASSAVAGSPDGLRGLNEKIRELEELRRAGPLPGDAAVWERLLTDARTVASSGEALVYQAAATEALLKDLPPFVDGTRELLIASGSVELVDELDRQSAVLAAIDAPGSATVGLRGERANTALDWLGNVLAALGGEQAPFDVTPLSVDADREKLAAMLTTFGNLSTHVTAITRDPEAASKASVALRSLERGADALLPAFATAAPRASANIPPWALPAGLGVAALLSLLLAAAYFRAARQAGLTAQQSNQNERNQQAILRLLDELGSLADGDLTVQATVTEDITGAIADSINYAIEALRGLVATINDTAIMVDSAAKQTESAAQSMSQSARQQAHEVKATTDELGAIVAAIEEVSGNAERSSDVARHSVDVAHKGGDAVRRTIDGMNAIRETIQETSKRIKRLGESSQEIGNIVELINDIAEQTNILALNASIQASMAGEAGRGFAVVADEVQRLAERCTNATKQIEVLVRTIQADTNEAVVSMERSTTDVVGGALLAENAGAALDEIEQVSNQIASLVQNISTSAREQNSLASHIDKRTTTLRKISDKTGRETVATASAIRKLSELATQLRGTVAGFQLPDVGADSGAYVTEEQLAEHGPSTDEPAATANARG
ncbi:MAG: methyl-accepting chemotaxis protein [Pseudomonadota bacterium]